MQASVREPNRSITRSPAASFSGFRPPLMSNVRQHRFRSGMLVEFRGEFRCIKVHVTAGRSNLYCPPHRRSPRIATARCAVALVGRGSISSSVPSRLQGIQNRRPSTSGETRRCALSIAGSAVVSRTGSHCSQLPTEDTGSTSPISIPNSSRPSEFVVSMEQIRGSSSTRSPCRHVQRVAQPLHQADVAKATPRPWRRRSSRMLDPV